MVAAGAPSSAMTADRSDSRQNVANAERPHFVLSTMPMTSRAASAIERLIWASSSVASLRPDSRLKPGRAEEGPLDVDLSKQAVAQRPDDRQRLPADEATGHRDRDARDARQLRGDAQAVGDDREMRPSRRGPSGGAPRRGPWCWHRRRCSRRRPPCPQRGGRCGPSRPAARVRGPRRRSPAGCPPRRSHRRGRGSAGPPPRGPEVLADGHGRDAEPRREVARHGLGRAPARAGRCSCWRSEAKGHGSQTEASIQRGRSRVGGLSNRVASRQGS